MQSHFLTKPPHLPLDTHVQSYLCYSGTIIIKPPPFDKLKARITKLPTHVQSHFSTMNYPSPPFDYAQGKNYQTTTFRQAQGKNHQTTNSCAVTFFYYELPIIKLPNHQITKSSALTFFYCGTKNQHPSAELRAAPIRLRSG